MYRLQTEDQNLIDKLASIADSTIAPHAGDVDANSRFPREALSALSSEGFLGLTVPTDFGGQGRGLRAAAAAVETVSQRDASAGMVFLMHLCGIQAYAANQAVCGDYLQAAAKGNHLTTLAWSERGSRSHFWAPMSEETQSGENVSLNGVKSWVTSAGEADGYVVTTRMAGAVSPMAVTLYTVERGDSGFSIESPWDALGLKGNASAPMVMENLTIPKSRAISGPGQGMDVMMGAVLPMFASGNCACSIGISEAAFSATQSHLGASKLQHLNQSLQDIPILRDRLARMRIRTDQARSYLADTFDKMEASDPATMLHVLGTKAQGAEVALEVTDLGMKACGGAAFSKHLSLERNFRDARAMTVMAPTTDVLHDFMGKALLGMELF